MTNYKNNIKIKSLNDSSLPLFEGYKEDKVIKPVQKPKVAKVEKKSGNLGEMSQQTNSETVKAINKPAKKSRAIKKPIKSHVSVASSAKKRFTG